jgi:hypothetical protein
MAHARPEKLDGGDVILTLFNRPFFNRPFFNGPFFYLHASLSLSHRERALTNRGLIIL